MFRLDLFDPFSSNDQKCIAACLKEAPESKTVYSLRMFIFFFIYTISTIRASTNYQYILEKVKKKFRTLNSF